MAETVSHPNLPPQYPLRLEGIAAAPAPPSDDDEPLQPVGDRVMLSSVGVGVPLTDAALFTTAIADMAQQLGYQQVIIEGEQVSGIRPHVEHRQPTQECPGCQRAISVYPGGKFYPHRCETPEDER
jgi:hypothetical protein